MHRLYKLLLLLLLGTSGFDVYAQQVQVLYGRTISSDRVGVVQLASIQNLNTGKRAISNRSGYFRITFGISDTIQVTAIGYDSTKLRGADLWGSMDTVLVLLRSKEVKLKEVRILSSNPKRDSIARAAAEFLKTDPLLNNHDRILNREKGGLMSPLTAMYQQFSKEGKDAAHFEEFLARMERLKQADRRYNRTFVKRVTTLPDIQLEEFMLYCRLDPDFVINATEYDLISATQRCAADFKAGKR